MSVQFTEEQAVWIEKQALVGNVKEGVVVRMAIEKAMEKYGEPKKQEKEIGCRVCLNGPEQCQRFLINKDGKCENWTRTNF